MAINRFAAAAVALPVLFAGPAVAETITHEFLHPSYDPQYVQYAASKGAFPVVVVDSPVPAETLLKELALPGNFPPTPLTPVGVGARSGGHLVLAFHAPMQSSGRAACEDPASLASGTTNGELRVQAAFCSGNEVLSEARMTTATPVRAGNAAFRGEMARLLARVLSSRSPNDDGACGQPNC